MRLRQLDFLLLAVLLPLAAWLRYDGIDFGFPLIVHPDEPRVADAATGILATGNPHPGTLLYPSFLVYVNTAMFALAERAGANAPADFYWFGRIATIAMSVLDVLLCYLIATRLAGTAAGIAAGCLLASSFLHGANGFLISTDAPMALWTTACLAASLAIVRTDPTAASPSRRAYLLAGAMVGLAVGAKYNGVFAATSVIAAHLATRREERFSPRDLINADLIAAGVASIVVFLITTPYALLDAGMLRDYLQLQQGAYSQHHVGATSESTSYAYYAASLQMRFGVPGLALAGIGALALALKDPRRAAVVLAFPVVYFGFMGAYRVHFDRNMVAILAPLAVLAGVGVQWLRLSANRLAKRAGMSPERSSAGALAFATAMILLASIPQAQKLRAHTAQLSLPDTRAIAKEWIDANLPEGAKIARENYTPPPDRERFEVTDLGYFGIARDPNLDRYDYLIVSTKDYLRFFSPKTPHVDMRDRYKRVFQDYPSIRRFAPKEGVSSGPVIKVLKVKR